MIHITKSMPLSKQGVNATIKALNALKTTLTDGKFQEDIREIAASALLAELENNIAGIYDPDGNLTGTVSMKSVHGLTRITWAGDQVAFLEFGTGITAIEGPDYPDMAFMALVGYEWHQYHGLLQTEYWKYKSNGEWITSFGIPAHAPMYSVFLDAEFILREHSFQEQVAQMIAGAVQKAFS